MSDPGFWHNLFSPAGFMPRRSCGVWTKGEIYLHNSSDFLIWAAYLAIPIVLLYFVFRRREGLPFRNLFLLFGMFIVSCGTTHFMEIVMFYYPIYRIAGLLKFFTAVISWATVVALAPAIPRALAMRSPDALESEVVARTHELQLLNAQKDDLLRSEQEARREVEALHREAESARREAERLRAEAEGNNRAKDEFLMTLSHELRTPLNTILGWSSLIRTGKLDEETQAQALEVIERSCQTQTRLVDDILEVSRIITGKMVIESSPLQVAPVVQAAYISAEPAARAKGLQLSLDIEDPAALVLGDSARLQQIVWNLLSNAIKFTPKGGEVKVTLRRVDSMSQIEVRDSGEGIAPEFLPHVFDRFRQADSSMTRQHGGLGLGLSIVRHLVEMHGGLVSVERRIGQRHRVLRVAPASRRRRCRLRGQFFPHHKRRRGRAKGTENLGGRRRSRSARLGRHDTPNARRPNALGRFRHRRVGTIRSVAPRRVGVGHRDAARKRLSTVGARSANGVEFSTDSGSGVDSVCQRQ